MEIALRKVFFTVRGVPARVVECAPTSITADQLTGATTRCADIRILFLRERLAVNRESSYLCAASDTRVHGNTRRYYTTLVGAAKEGMMRTRMKKCFAYILPVISATIIAEADAGAL